MDFVLKCLVLTLALGTTTAFADDVFGEAPEEEAAEEIVREIADTNKSEADEHYSKCEGIAGNSKGGCSGSYSYNPADPNLGYGLSGFIIRNNPNEINYHELKDILKNKCKESEGATSDEELNKCVLAEVQSLIDALDVKEPVGGIATDKTDLLMEKEVFGEKKFEIKSEAIGETESPSVDAEAPTGAK
jgi:hypothetical protein